ncbi:MAG: DDE-type integrase/transposase/recombinase [Deltaproteobacteria bacterium]|nr:DDE-type integrase/transposase/recombinase [Deltaproteobacteria bacterium]
MDLLTKEGAKLAPKDTPEGVAIFRAQVIGPLLTRAFSSHGELADAIRMLARHKHLPPGASATRFYSEATIERWYYRFKKRGLAGLTPKRRSDVGHARELTDAQRDLLCAVRREHPSTSTALILRTLELDGRLAKGAVSLSTINRLFRSQGLDKVTLRVADGRVRLRWQADRVDALWHADVCHGPAMKIGGRTVPLRIHAILDDHSRYIVAIAATTTEREVEMLSLLVKAMRGTGRRPEALYLDNGSTYTGEVLATVCSRLSIGLLHATPHDPQARGKMERFWRTLREGCLDHLGTPASLHDVQVRLLAFLAKHYHRAPHASLMGKGPAEVYETAPRYEEKVDDVALGAALTVHGRRRVRRDGTLEIGGTTFETRAGFLSGRVVHVGRTLLDPSADPWIEHEGQRYLLGRVDAQENARRKKQGPFANRPRRGLDVSFDPPGALLDALVGRDGGAR